MFLLNFNFKLKQNGFAVFNLLSFSDKIIVNLPCKSPMRRGIAFCVHTEDLTENGSGSKCCEFQDSSKLSSGLDRKCGSAKNNWLHEETHEEKEIWAALKLSTLATTSVLS